jgi:aldehyde:ferredoxin oxidoreductase
MPNEKWIGDILEIDLTTKQIRRRPFEEKTEPLGLYGRAFNIAWLYSRLTGPIDPLSPENPLLFSCGLLTGTAAPTSSRLHINAVSPLTSILGSSNVGGRFGHYLRSCGIIGMILSGRAAAPVILCIDESGIFFKDAKPFRGLCTDETQNRLEAEFQNRKIKTLIIGPAGENRIPIANIISDRDHAAGRTGMGAVMGAKNVKAIVVLKGNKNPVPANPEEMKQETHRFVSQVKASPDFNMFSRYGGAGFVEWAVAGNITGTHYYRDRPLPGLTRMTGQFLKSRVIKTRGCHRCPVQCKAVLSFDEGPLKGKKAYRPEFEPMINLGAKCGLSDVQAVIGLDNLCTRLGLDSISAGNALAFAMDLTERGILAASSLNGASVRWGDAALMESLIRDMAGGNGLGALLARGVRTAARALNAGAEEFAAQVKGLELTAYHPASMPGTALGYAVSSRGGDYNNVYASLEKRWTPEKAKQEFGTEMAVDPTSAEGKGKLVARAVKVNAVIDSLGLCKVPTLSLLNTFDLVYEAALTRAFTGQPVTTANLWKIGELTAAAERLFNRRLGVVSADDTLPSRFFRNGNHHLTREMFHKMRADFYREMKWDEEGRPLPGCITELENRINSSLP